MEFKETLDICIWKIITDKKGTTFPQEHECRICDGYNFNCDKYQPVKKYESLKEYLKEYKENAKTHNL